jgi:WD40 repeat protein
MSFEAWKEEHVAASECQLPIVAPPPGLKREAVSSRLRQSLMHPDQRGVLVGLRYSADGRRLIAGHIRSGVVQVWDTASGQQLTSIETGQRNGSLDDYFLFSPDGRFLYVDRSTTRLRSILGKDKRFYHWEFSGGVRSWEVATGKPLHDFQPDTGRGLSSMDLSPDGSTLLTVEGVTGDYETPRAKFIDNLWDARTGQRRGTLPENVSRADFSPDSNSILAIAVNDKFETTALQFLDAATGEVRRSIPAQRQHLRTYQCAFAPDGKRVACHGIDEKRKVYWLKCWDVESGREIASIESEKPSVFGGRIVFSPNGRMLTTYSLLEHKLSLIDVEKRAILKQIPIGSGRIWRESVISPDGKWIAVISQDSSMNLGASMLKPEDLAQPRILLIEPSTGEIRETIIAPPGVAASLCFSPDGKTLASNGDGRVLLWDMTKPPGTQQPAD